MSEQPNPAPEEVQPADSSVEETGTEEQALPGVNWEERAKEHQSWGTRLAQENAELKAEAQLVAQLKSEDPAEQRKALEALGYTVPDEEEEVSPAYVPDPRIDEIQQWRESLTEKEQREEHYSEYREQYDSKLTEMGVPEAFLTNVADIAYHQLAPVQTPQGPKPDLEGAVAHFNEVAELFAEVPAVQKKAQQKWASTKPRSPLTQAAGGEGTKVLDTDKHENRVAYMLAQLQDRE